MPFNTRVLAGMPAAWVAWVACCAVVAIVACGSDAAAPGTRGAPAPSVATYDVTTVLDQFTFETPAPSPPDCPDASQAFCTHLRANAIGSLAGTFTATTAATTGSSVPLFEFSAAMFGDFCTAYDLDHGCTAVAPVETVTYTDQEPIANPAAISLYGDSGQRIGLTNVHWTRDSVYGDVTWNQNATRNPPTFRGRFVALLRP